MHLRLATYNIHACIGGDGRFDPARTVRVLRELDAGILALQEVEHHRIDDIDLLQRLATDTGMRAIAGPTLLRETRQYGNALLTRLPVTRVNRIDISEPGGEPRGAIDALLDWNGVPLQVVATHLGLRPDERRRQVRRLLALFRHRAQGVSVLLGDLNEWFLWGRPLRWLHRHFTAVPYLPTWPARLPLFALDRIWVRPHDALLQLETHLTPTARQASDHLPLKAIVSV